MIPAAARIGGPRVRAWGSGWVMMVCEWRRWRRLGLSRWAALCILIHSLHRLP